MSGVLYLSLKDLQDPQVMDWIHRNQELDYYWTDDWTPEFYAHCAYQGFIAVSTGGFLVPEMQKAYALLDWENLHISSHVRKLIKQSRFSLHLNPDPRKVISAVQEHHENCWMGEEYRNLLLQLAEGSEHLNCRVLSVELLDKEQNLVAGEIGYITGRIYTSLSGFSSRWKEHRNTGTLQMVMLAQHLQDQGFDFWNMGHPYMDYKLQLGARILPRDAFLSRWKESRDHRFTSGLFSL